MGTPQPARCTPAGALVLSDSPPRGAGAVSPPASMSFPGGVRGLPGAPGKGTAGAEGGHPPPRRGGLAGGCRAEASVFGSVRRLSRAGLTCC